MKKCTFPADELIKNLKELLQNPQTPLSKKMMEHIKVCKSCSRIVNSPRLAESYLKLISGDLARISESVAESDFSTDIEPGTIIDFAYNNCKKSVFAVALEKSSVKESFKSISIYPLFLAPASEELSENDVVVPGSENPLRLPFLIEFWNKCKIKTGQIKKLHGRISLSKYQKEYIESENFDIYDYDQQNKIKYFRMIEKAFAFFYSDWNMNFEIANDVLADDRFMVLPFKPESLISFDYNLSDKEVHTFMPLEYESQEQLKIAADTGEEISEFSIKLYRLLCTLIENSELPLRIRRGYDAEFKIVCVNKQEFRLSICFQNNNEICIDSRQFALEVGVEVLKLLMKHPLKSLKILEQP